MTTGKQVWACATCGGPKSGKSRHASQKYCSLACTAQAQRGAGNHNYQGGPKSRRKTDRVRASPAQIKALISWVEARDALGSAEDLAAKLGLPKRTVARVASHHRRKMKSPAVAILRCQECYRTIRTGRHCDECSRTAWRSSELTAVAL
jgi:hypothetical protein